MQQKFFYLLLLFFVSLGTASTSYAHLQPPTDAALEAPQTGCNLPAPTNLQMNQPNPYQATYTWDPVTGAAGYVATLSNLSNPGTITMILPGQANTTVTLPVQPGDLYLFTVACLCSLNPPDPSGNVASSTNRMQGIVIDLVVHRNGCSPSGNPIATLIPGQTYSNLDTEPYYIKMNTSGGNSALLEFFYKPANGAIPEMFEFKAITEIPYVTAQAQWSTSYYAPECKGTNAKVNLNNFYEGVISFPDVNTIKYNQGNFSSLQLYRVCQGGNGSNGDSKNRSSSPNPVTTQAQAALDNILPVNPFSSDLSLRCTEHPLQAITAQLFDLSGHLHLQREIQPDDFSANTCSLPTADLLPGMYFLRLEAAPGVIVTHKVVKF